MYGGFKKTNKRNLWPQVACDMGFEWDRNEGEASCSQAIKNMGDKKARLSNDESNAGADSKDNGFVNHLKIRIVLVPQKTKDGNIEDHN
ncbi:hypothetical protein E3N88_23842 [Mikania micrantha]|uniref:ARID domain-containing protein n=1 Tax=Mikania micrantha TaxID=192012 RepID=A0A5N6NEF0_9ASTR|nr:hypothetical protein E3N88_23842 [Mikania micrantha]